MRLSVVLPSRLLARFDAVEALVAEGPSGSFGVLPGRADFAAALVPGILSLRHAGGEEFLAVDEGLLVKAGEEVWAAVRRALAGARLGELRKAVEEEFLKLDEEERRARLALSRLEAGLARRFMELRHES